MRPRLPRLPRPLQHRERSHARSEAEEIHQAPAHGSSSTEIANTQHMSPAGDIEGLWRAALDEYRRSCGIDLCDRNDNMVFDFHQCRTSVEILDVLKEYSDVLRDSREGGRVSRVLLDSLRPLIDGISVVLDTYAETGSALGVPGGKGIFAAFAVLLRAAHRVTRDFDDMVKFFIQLRGYVQRLQVQLRGPGHLSGENKEIVVKAFVKMLEALALATRMLKRGRLGQFVRAIFSSEDNIQTAITAFEDIQSDQDRLQITELSVELTGVAHGVYGMNASISELQTGVGAVQNGIGAIQDGIVAVQGGLGAVQDMLRVMEDRVMDKVMSRFSVVEGKLIARQETLRMNDALSVDSGMRQPPLLIGPSPQITTEERRIAIPRSAARDLFSFGRQLRAVITRFGAKDQDIIWRALATLFSWAVDAVGSSSNSRVIRTTTTTPIAIADIPQIAEMVIPTVLMFLLMFIAWKLASVSRPLPSSPDDVILVDVLGEVFRLHSDTFSTWENTHTFLLNAFKGRVGDSYVRRRDYGLGNAQHVVIERDAWSKVIQPGTWLKMSIIVREHFSQCPYCRTATTGREEYSDDGRTICSRCEFPYSIVQSRADSNVSLEALDEEDSMTSANQSPSWMWTWPSSPSPSPPLIQSPSEDTELNTPESPATRFSTGSPHNSIAQAQPPSSRNSAFTDEGPSQRNSSRSGRDMKQFQRIIVEFRPSADKTRRSVPLYALLIGIDEYQCEYMPNLSGAVVGADAIDAYLRVDLHVPSKQIVNLRNEQATRDAVIREIQALSVRENIRQGDPILIYFAGHGTATPAPRGRRVGNQSISLIMPYDTDTKLVNAGMSKFAIPSRTIGALLHNLAERLGNDATGANITVIFDCCHSGSGSRNTQFDDTRRTRSFTSQMVLPADLDQDIWKKVPQGLSVNVAKGFAHSGTKSHILLAACRETESAFDNNERGYFTHELLSALRQVEPDKATYQDLMRLISNNIAGQTPQCEGYNVGRVLFDARVPSQRRTVYQVQRPKKGAFAVDVGSIHGVTKETLFAVYMNGDFETDDIPVATMAAAKLYAFRTELKYLGPLTCDGQLALGGTSACFVAPNSVGLAAALRLHVAEPTEQDQRCVLEALGKVVQAQQASGRPSILLRNDPGQANLSVHATGDIVTYTIHDRSITDRGLSQLCFTTKAEVSAIQPVLSAAAHFFWHLHHAPKKNDLKERIEIRVFALEPDTDADMGADLRLPYRPRGSDLYNSGVVDVVADDDTPYGLLVRNKSLAPLHVWAFYFNCSTLAIREYYREPVAGTNAAAPLPPAPCNHVKCGHTEDEIDSMKGELTIGYGPGGGQPHTFFIPDSDPDLDVGFIKLFISTEPVDLSSIAQHSPFETSLARDITTRKPRPTEGVWDTFTIAVVQHKM